MAYDAIVPRLHYAVSGTEIAYAATRFRSRCAIPTARTRYPFRIMLRTPYAMSGTDLAYATTRNASVASVPRSVCTQTVPISLCCCYAMPGTEIAYAATSRPGHHLSTAHAGRVRQPLPSTGTTISVPVPLLGQYGACGCGIVLLCGVLCYHLVREARY
eukprot:3439867-Rhodomonas_salina.1